MNLLRALIDRVRGPRDPGPLFDSFDREAPAGMRLDGQVVWELPKARCESRKREGSRSWRCTKDFGHVASDKPAEARHGNGPAGRSWA